MESRKKKLFEISGTLSTLTYLIGFMILFKINPQTYEELNNISLASYNIVGMKFRWWSVLLYLTTGFLNVLFCIGLFKNHKDKSIPLVGKIFLSISALIWLSFGVYPCDPLMGDISDHILVIRVLTLIVTCFLGLLFLGLELEIIIADKFLKWYTLSSGILILSLSLLSTFVYNDETWIRTNVSLTIYFIWLGVFGLRMFLKENK